MYISERAILSARALSLYKLTSTLKDPSRWRYQRKIGSMISSQGGRKVRSTVMYRNINIQQENVAGVLRTEYALICCVGRREMEAWLAPHMTSIITTGTWKHTAWKIVYPRSKFETETRTSFLPS